MTKADRFAALKNPWTQALLLGALFAIVAGVVFASDGRLFTTEYLLVAAVAFALPLVRTMARRGGQKAGRNLRDHHDRSGEK